MKIKCKICIKKEIFLPNISIVIKCSNFKNNIFEEYELAYYNPNITTDEYPLYPPYFTDLQEMFNYVDSLSQEDIVEMVTDKLKRCFKIESKNVKDKELIKQHKKKYKNKFIIEI